MALENQTEAILGQIVARRVAHPEANALFERIHMMAKDQHTALSARLEAIRKEGSNSDAPGTVPGLGDLTVTTGSESENAVSFALHTVSTILSHAIFGYTILQAVAHRYRDSKIGGGENTGDVSEQHTRNYAAMAQEINQLIHDVVIWELSQAQDECRCTCPSCNLGVCLCSVSSRIILNSAWAETSPPSQNGISVQLPRSGSSAEAAGLQEGEVVVAADGRAIHSPPDLQSVIRDHLPGGEINLTVQRKGTGTVDIVVAKF